MVNLNDSESSHYASKRISEEHFEELFCDFYPKLLAYAISILNDKQAAEDIVQEVFLYVWEKKEYLRTDAGFYSYIFQSTYTKCVDYIRKDSRLDKREQELLLKFAEEYQSYLENDAHPIQELFSQDFNKKLEALLEQLPESRREVFKLIYIDGLKAREVASKLDMPLRTVESHIYLTLKFLRTQLSPSDFFILALLFRFF